MNSPVQAELVKEEIASLLVKSAIEPVMNVKSLGFYSCIFLVAKKNGFETGHRPVRPKQVCTSRKVQDGHKHVYKGHSDERCVGRIIGFEGRVPSHTCPSSVKEVSEIHLSR